MRKISLALSTCLFALSNPAFAKGQASAEVRLTGAGNGHGATGLAGLGAGYDWDLGEKMIIGAQATGEIDTQGEFGIIAAVARIGPRLGSRGKAYILAGIGFLPNFEDNGAHPVAGAGIEIGIGRKMYGKIEYRQFLGSNVRSGDEGNSGNLHQFGFAVGVRF